MRIAPISVITLMICLVLAVPSALAIDIYGGPEGEFPQGAGQVSGMPYAYKNQEYNAGAADMWDHVGIWIAAYSRNGEGEGYGKYTGSLNQPDTYTDPNDDDYEYQSATYYTGTVNVGIIQSDDNIHNGNDDTHAFARIGASSYANDMGTDGRGQVAGSAIIESWIGEIPDSGEITYYPNYGGEDYLFDAEGEGYALAEGTAGFNSRYVCTCNNEPLLQAYGQVDGKTYLEAKVEDTDNNDGVRGYSRIMSHAIATKFSSSNTYSEATDSINMEIEARDDSKITGYADAQNTAYSGAWDDSATSQKQDIDETVYSKVYGIVTAEAIGTADDDRAEAKAYLSQLAYHERDGSQLILAVDRPLDWTEFGDVDTDTGAGYGDCEDDNIRARAMVERDEVLRTDRVYAIGKAENGGIQGIVRDGSRIVTSDATTGAIQQYENGVAAGCHLQHQLTNGAQNWDDGTGSSGVSSDVEFWQDAEITRNDGMGYNDIDMDVFVDIYTKGAPFPFAADVDDTAGSWMGIYDSSVKATDSLQYSIDTTSLKSLNWVAGNQPFVAGFYEISDSDAQPVQFSTVVVDDWEANNIGRFYEQDFDVRIDRNY